MVSHNKAENKEDNKGCVDSSRLLSGVLQTSCKANAQTQASWNLFVVVSGFTGDMDFFSKEFLLLEKWVQNQNVTDIPMLHIRITFLQKKQNKQNRENNKLKKQDCPNPNPSPPAWQQNGLYFIWSLNVKP